MAKKRVSAIYEVIKGLWDENPVLRSLLGLCPVLAVTNSAINGLAMGLATTFVLLSSGIFISLLRKIIPHQVRIASFIVIIATFVTVADRFLAAYFPEISKDLGPYVPLIVVNCIAFNDRMRKPCCHCPAAIACITRDFVVDNLWRGINQMHTPGHTAMISNDLVILN